MANESLILAGVAGGGAQGLSLAWFGPLGSAAPASAVAALDAAYKDAGLVSTDGLTATVSENQQTIDAYGTFQPVRKLVTSSDTTFGLTFLESGPVPLSIYHRKPLTGAGSISPDATGAFNFTTGTHTVQHYACVFDIVDGANHLRAFCPDVEVTDRGNWQVSAGNAITYPVTLTAYVGSDGVAVHWWYVMSALAT